MDNQPRVFLSHSSKDKPFVRELDRALSAYGVTTFPDERDIRVGEDIPERLYAEIKASSHVCYIISANSVNSNWVRDELSKAAMIEKSRQGVFILPVLIDKTEIPISVLNRRYADFTQESNKPIHERSGFKLLLEALGVSPSAFELARAPDITVILNFAQLSSRISLDLVSIRTRAEQIRDSGEPPRQWLALAVVYYRMLSDCEGLCKLLVSYTEHIGQVRPYLTGTNLVQQVDRLDERAKLLRDILSKMPSDPDRTQDPFDIMERVVLEASVMELSIHILLSSLLYFAKDGAAINLV
jgi:hypothetical protein